MAKNTLQIAAITVLMIPAASGLFFNVDVDQSTNHSIKDLQYKNSTEIIQNINASVENIGSIGCTYRLKARFKQGSKTFERFSPSKPLWPGNYSRITLRYIPAGFKGKINTTLYVTYCGREKKISSFAFNDTEKTLVNKSVDSRTVNANQESAKIKIENGTLLIPKEEPPYWKTSSAKIVNNTAKITYDAPIFQKSETITYTVVDKGEVVGKTKVKLTPQPTLLEKINDRKLQVITVFTLVSILVNILLAMKILGYIEKIKQIEYDLPDFRDKH